MSRRACIVCGTPTTEGSRCAAHQRRKRPWQKSTPGTYGWAWAQRAKQVKKEEPTCRICGAPTTVTDHIVPKAEARIMGWTEQQINDRSNLRGLCDRCHRLKTQQESARGSRRAHAHR